MQIAVTGATGQLGRLVVETLRKRVDPGQIVALARTPNKAADLGVEVREADYDRPETLAIALAGVDRLLLISSSEVGRRAPQHRNVIKAAGGELLGEITRVPDMGYAYRHFRGPDGRVYGLNEQK